jgi:hypothetical protein
MNMPTLLFDMIKGIIDSCEDLYIVEETVTQVGISHSAYEARADVVILSNTEALIDDFYEVLYRRPRLKILAISVDGRRGSLYELQPRVKAIGDISAESLIAAIRGRTSIAGKAVAQQ